MLRGLAVTLSWCGKLSLCLQVHVEFTDKQGGIKLEGPPEEVDEAREKLEAMIADLKSKLCYDQLVVDPK